MFYKLVIFLLASFSSSSFAAAMNYDYTIETGYHTHFGPVEIVSHCKKGDGCTSAVVKLFFYTDKEISPTFCGGGIAYDEKIGNHPRQIIESNGKEFCFSFPAFMDPGHGKDRISPKQECGQALSFLTNLEEFEYPNPAPEEERESLVERLSMDLDWHHLNTICMIYTFDLNDENQRINVTPLSWSPGKASYLEEGLF